MIGHSSAVSCEESVVFWVLHVFRFSIDVEEAREASAEIKGFPQESAFSPQAYPVSPELSAGIGGVLAGSFQRLPGSATLSLEDCPNKGALMS